MKASAKAKAIVTVDGIMVGATDLRFSLGLAAGSPDGDEPEFLSALAKIQHAADVNGLAVLGFAVTPEIVRRRLRLGWKALICHADASGIFNSGTQVVQKNQTIADKEFGSILPVYRLYGYEQNPRTRIVRIVAEAEGIPLQLCEVVPRDGIGKADYIKKFPLARGKIPGLEGPKGLKLTETVAIASYLASVRERCSLFGDGSEKQRGQVVMWMSWANQELLPTLALWFLPLIPFTRDPVKSSATAMEKGRQASLELLDALESYLETKENCTFLVGDQVTLADILVMIVVSRGLQWVLDEAWRRKNPNIMRHFQAVERWPPVKAIVPSFKMVDRLVVDRSH